MITYYELLQNLSLSFKKHFPLDIIQNSVVSTQILAKNTEHGEKNVLIIKFSSILTKTGGTYFYIVNLYFPFKYKENKKGRGSHLALY